MSNQTFQEIVEAVKSRPTPLQELITELAELTKKKETTVRMWIWGRQTPDELTRSVIARHFDVSPETLFPTTKETES